MINNFQGQKKIAVFFGTHTKALGIYWKTNSFFYCYWWWYV